MKQAIKRAMIALFPELGAGLHLDRYARVVAVADAPGEGAASERFRPRFAVDIQILTPDGEPDPAFPVYTAVPLPVQSGAGQEKGLFSFPEPGAQVVVGFAYGRPDHPIIRQVYPFGVSLPAVAQGEQLWQSTPTTFQRADADGNWSRKTGPVSKTKAGSALCPLRSRPPLSERKPGQCGSIPSRPWAGINRSKP